MILSYETVGNIYWNFCEYNLNMNLDQYLCKSINDTINRLLIFDSDSGETGEKYMIYALSEVFEKILKEKNNVKYDHIMKHVPEKMMENIIKFNKKINDDLILAGTTPADLFRTPKKGYLDYL